MEIKKIVRTVPFIILGLILITTWYKIIKHENIAIGEHYLVLGAVILNLLLYLIKFKYGVVLIGILLCLGIFGLLVFTPLKSLTNYGLAIAKVEINTPYMQWGLFLLLILYLVLNGAYVWKMFSRNGGNKAGSGPTSK